MKGNFYGASQGGRLAFELVLERILIPRMAIIVVGAFREVEKYREKIGDFPVQCALRFIVGAKDSFANETVKLHEMIKEKGVDSRLKIYENMGHGFPEDFDEYLRKMLFY
ncbi:MAG TPA: dienelactone hydrolase family protein [Mesotoga sp.]|nr:dienelactone hydrolase family protein [Mesotoga sp.]